MGPLGALPLLDLLSETQCMLHWRQAANVCCCAAILLEAVIAIREIRFALPCLHFPCIWAQSGGSSCCPICAHILKPCSGLIMHNVNVLCSALIETVKEGWASKLPNTEHFKLVYQDKDGDLLLMQASEPWSAIMADALRIIIACK